MTRVKNHHEVFLEEQVQRLQVNAVYSYKELCKLLSCKEYSGDSKKAQRKVWDLYFSLEKTGYKYKVTEIFQTKKVIDFDTLFAADEEHIKTSAKALIEFFNNSGSKVSLEEDNEVKKLLLFSKDFATICGYISEDYYNYRQGYRLFGTKSPLETYFYTIIGNKFSELLRNLLISLQRKGLLLHSRKVLTKWDSFLKQRIIMTDDEVSLYNKEVIELWKRKGLLDKVSTFGFSDKDWEELGKRTEKIGTNIYVGYYVSFVEKELRAGQKALAENKLHFGKTVTKVFNRDKAIAERKIQEAKNFQFNKVEQVESFLEKVFNMENALVVLEQMLEERL